MKGIGSIRFDHLCQETRTSERSHFLKQYIQRYKTTSERSKLVYSHLRLKDNHLLLFTTNKSLVLEINFHHA